MTPSRTRRATALAAALALCSVTALTAGLTVSAASAAPDPDVSSTSKQTTTSADRKAAVDALATVRSIFRPQPGADARAIRDAGGVEATMALRDLAARIDSLDEDDRAAAQAFLARPTDGSDGDSFTVEYGIAEATPVCTPDLCVHYVTGDNANDDAPPLTDTKLADGSDGTNGIPDYVDTVVRVMTNVHNTYSGAGYRSPRPDGTRGGDARTDIYLAELGSRGVYGYCTTDQPNPPQNAEQFYDRWAFCLLDNDYAGFPRTPLENIQVTAAHEYFHATQYAYDAFEDSWFLEATATWAEDELYDGVNDNVQYLKASPLTAPFIPVDTFVGNGKYNGFHYGTWTFFRFLTEKYKAKRGKMPELVLDMMKKVDGSLGAPDLYSWKAVDSVLRSKKTTASQQFFRYSVANRRPKQTYSEGKAQKYPTGPLRGKATLTKKVRRTKPATTKLDHLTSATYRITPKKLSNKRTKLKVVLDMAKKKNGSMAAVTVVPKKGKAKVSTIKLSKRGKGSKRVPFSSKKVKYVEVTLANTSGKTKCFQTALSPYSCFGIPKHDNQKQKITARVVR